MERWEVGQVRALSSFCKAATMRRLKMLSLVLLQFHLDEFAVDVQIKITFTIIIISPARTHVITAAENRVAAGKLSHAFG